MTLGLSPRQVARRGEKPPLVTLALPSLGLGGAEIVNASLAKQFLERGLRVDFVTGWEEPGETDVPVPDGARLIVIGAQQTRGVLIPFTRYLRRERPDVVIASLWPFSSTCVLAHQLARSRAQMVIWEHNTLSVQYRNLGALHRFILHKSIAYACRQAHLRVAVSCGVADDLTALSGLPRERFAVVHNPVLDRPGLDAATDAAERVWGGWKGPRIITVGRFKAQKNHALLIRAFKNLLERTDARLLILGGGDLFDATNAQIRSEGLVDKIIAPGPDIDPMPYYRSADLFVLSSDYEGFGNVIVEALACGVPVVSTDCKSGPAEILENGRFGRLVPVGDAAALAEAMLEALGATHDREALKRRAADFEPERIADQYYRLLFPAAPPIG